MSRPRKEKAEKCIRQNISVEPEQLEMMLEYCQKRRPVYILANP